MKHHSALCLRRLLSSSLFLLWISLLTITRSSNKGGLVGVVLVDGFQRGTLLEQRWQNQKLRTTVPMKVITQPAILYNLLDQSISRNKNKRIISFSAIHKDDAIIATPSVLPVININGDNTTTAATTTTTTANVITTSTSSTNPTTTPTDSIHVPFWIVLWRFTRPHTLIGSALAIPSLHLLASPLTTSWSSNSGGTTTAIAAAAAAAATNVATTFTTTTAFHFIMSILYATIPALLMNLYITGLNQITDVDIDKINKPNLPIAAGILKQRDAIITCSVALVTSLYLGRYGHARYSTQGLQVALWGSGILGTLYSLEPFRLKRYPVFAALCIVAVRGAIINASFFAHAMAAVFHQPSATVLSCLMNDPRCLFSSIFFGIFGIVIALMKDVPDVLGDQSSNVRTFSVRIGPERMFHTSRKLLMGLFYVCTAGFVQRAITATTTPLAVCRYVIAMSCLVAARSVRQQSKVVDPTNPSQVYEYYMHLWKIFYMSYVMLPFAR